jgi:hypothetical protein
VAQAAAVLVQVLLMIIVIHQVLEVLTQAVVAVVALAATVKYQTDPQAAQALLF